MFVENCPKEITFEEPLNICMYFLQKESYLLILLFYVLSLFVLFVFVHHCNALQYGFLVSKVSLCPSAVCLSVLGAQSVLKH